MRKLESKSSLAIVISQLENFKNGEIELEQYSTPSEIAAEMLWSAALEGNVIGKTVLDAACGPGFLGLGALLLGARKVLFVDISKDALGICRRNYNKLKRGYEIGEAVFLNESIENFNEKVDVVLQNPPFGTKKKHADKMFLEKAFTLAPVVYSLHKITSKSFIQALSKDHGFGVGAMKEIDLGLKQTMKYHKKKRHYIKCGIWKLVKE